MVWVVVESTLVIGTVSPRIHNGTVVEVPVSAVA
jgi:hypothetical protein